MSADDNLRDALAKALQDELRAQGVLYEFDPSEPDLTKLMMSTGEAADLTAVIEAQIKVIKDWTVEEWRPIETAPLDENTMILVWKDGWHDVARYFGHNDDDGRPAFFNGDVYVKPTHWMPLPSGPSA